MRLSLEHLSELKGWPIIRLVRAVCVVVWPISLLMPFYYRMRFTSRWYDFLNRNTKDSFEAEPLNLDEVEQAAVRSLEADGIYVSNIEELLPNVSLDKICSAARRLLNQPIIREQIKRRRSRVWRKWYVIRAFGFQRNVEPLKPFLDFLLHPRILNILNSYFGLYCRLNYLDIWHNLPRRDDESAIASEFWHRDHEDWRTIKIFLYISDVTLKQGPFTYLCGSQRNGEYGSVFSELPGLVYHPPVSDPLDQIPAERQMVCAGKSGTVVICDASGFHKGGRSMSKPRTVLVATFASNAAIHPMRYRLPHSIDEKSLDNTARYAMRLPLA